MKRSVVQLCHVSASAPVSGCLRAAVLALLLGSAPVAGAASYTNSASGNWSLSGSWTGTAPSAGGAADAVVVFDPAGADASTNNLTGTFKLNRMEFASGAGPFRAMR